MTAPFISLMPGFDMLVISGRGERSA